MITLVYARNTFGVDFRSVEVFNVKKTIINMVLLIEMWYINFE